MLFISNRKAKSEVENVDGRLVSRMKLKIAVQHLAPLRKIVSKGFITKNRKTGFNKAVSMLIQTGMKGAYPDIEVDPARVQLTNGGLSQVLDPQISRTGNRLEMVFHNVLLNAASNADDRVYLCAYNSDLGIAGINETPTVRMDGRLELGLPPQLRGLPVDVYVFAHDRDGKLFSKSQYLGCH